MDSHPQTSPSSNAEKVGWQFIATTFPICCMLLAIVAWVAPLLNDAGRAVFVVVIATGVSVACAHACRWRLKKLIDGRAALSRRDEDARLAAEAANRAKSEFLANMSHEIRTPLNGILGYTELLIRGADNGNEKERLELLNIVRDSGRQLLQMINDILDFSRIESGTFRVEVIACSPDEILNEIVATMRSDAEQKGLTLAFRWDSRVPDTIQTDPHRLKQLLTNLVGNAIKFTDAGSVLVVAAVVESKQGPKLRLDVRDTGVGISADRLNSVFDPFTQVDQSLTRKNGGTGLGLTISQKIAHALGGSVKVVSEPYNGSVFSATLSTGDLYAVRFTDAKSPGANAGLLKSLPPVRLDGTRVLVVDDMETNLRLVDKFLSRAGAAVATAANGALGVEAAEAGFFDVILMDMQMPVLDGYSATSRLRAHGYDGPIIALTAHAMHGDREKCQAAGCSGYISKPINMDDLTVAVREAIGTRYTSSAVSSPADQATVRSRPTQD